jgi:hypothetical protein
MYRRRPYRGSRPRLRGAGRRTLAQAFPSATRAIQLPSRSAETLKMDRPRVLILDDGELDRVYRALERAHLAPLRICGDDIQDGLPMPCELLVTSGARTLRMPCLNVASPGPAPTWICVHTQDFHPLRDRLRRLGVHYLLQASADDRTIGLFLGQMLYTGNKHRREPRLPIGCELTWTWKSRTDQKAALLDLSPRGVRIAMHEELPVGAVLDLKLPVQLAGEAIEVSVRVARCEPAHAADGERFEVLLLWDELEPERRAWIDQLVSRNRIGPRVAPLAPRPYVDGSVIPD